MRSKKSKYMKETVLCVQGVLCRFKFQENDKMKISYSMQKSYDSVNHKALHQVYELDTKNPMIYKDIFSTGTVIQWMQANSSRMALRG